MNRTRIVQEGQRIESLIRSGAADWLASRDAVEGWRLMGVEVTADQLDSASRSAAACSFAGLSIEQTVCRIVRQTATHEGKHKWDESQDTARQWILVDFEVSAHLAEAVYGGSVHYSVLCALNRLSGYSQYADMRKHLKPLASTLWRGLVAHGGDASGAVALRAVAARAYADYVTLDGARLPALTGFEKTVVAPLARSPFGACVPQP